MSKYFSCSSCSNESYDVIPIARVIRKLDELFDKNDLIAVGELLDYWEREARILRDNRGLLEILNEQIGYFRRTNNKDRALSAASEAFELIEQLGLERHESSGTIYLNGATTLKSFGKTAEAMEYYDKAKAVYDDTLPADDYKLAAYFNNVSSAYKELGDIKNAENACYQAISILEKHENFMGEIAVTHISLAHLYYDADVFDERVYEHVERAWELLSSDKNTHDGNFAFLCSKCYPSFAYFGYFDYESKIKALVEKIYEGN